MSSKTLKTYRIQFLSQLDTLSFKVKFPCKIKIIWKRSNESAQSSLVPVENGLAKFNGELMKIYVNMYYDTSTNRFVEKKCMWSFLIVTEKGEKSAGSFCYDLAQFFNKRVYEVEEDFVLEKCPIVGTKMRMKIYYQESTQTGYDSMSRISTSEQMDLSTASMDVGEIDNGSVVMENKSKISEETGSKGDLSSSSKSQKKQQQKQQVESNFQLLNQSDVSGQKQNPSSEPAQSSQKITQNIQALTKISSKINDFVTRCSSSIKSQVQTLKLQNKTLTQQLNFARHELSNSKTLAASLQTQLSTLQSQLSTLSIQSASSYSALQSQYDSLSLSHKKSLELIASLQQSLSSSAQSSNSHQQYLSQLKASHQEQRTALEQKLASLEKSLLSVQKQNKQKERKIQDSQKQRKELKKKLEEEKQKVKGMERRERQRERQLGELREKMEIVYGEIVKNLGNIL